jgi:hypothetical protein
MSMSVGGDVQSKVIDGINNFDVDVMNSEQASINNYEHNLTFLVKSRVEILRLRF